MYRASDEHRLGRAKEATRAQTMDLMWCARLLLACCPIGAGARSRKFRDRTSAPLIVTSTSDESDDDGDSSDDDGVSHQVYVLMDGVVVDVLRLRTAHCTTCAELRRAVPSR